MHLIPHRSAQSDPVIPDPEIQGGIELDPTCSFLILMSDGLYKSLEDALGLVHINREIASMVATEFSQQTTLNGVAQAVVDRVVRLHHDACTTANDHRRQLCQKRDDMLLLVRNFSYPLPNSITSPSISSLPPLSIHIPSPVNSPSKSPPPTLGVASGRPNFFISKPAEPIPPSSITLSGSTISSTNDSCEDPTQLTQSLRSGSMHLDENGRLQPYVDFKEFYHFLDGLSETQLEAFNVETEPRPPYEPIAEEPPGTEGEHEASESDKTTKL